MASPVVEEVDAAHNSLAGSSFLKLQKTEEGLPLIVKDEQFRLSAKHVLDLFICVSLIVIWTINAVLFKKSTNAMGNYPSFISQFKAFFLFIFFCVVWQLEERVWKMITPEMLRSAKWPLIVLGINECVEGMVQTVGGIHTAGSLQVLLLQALIPFSMVGSFFVLRSRYVAVQYVGAAVIVIGVLIALWPNLFPLQIKYLGWNLVFLSCTIFAAVGAIGKELHFKTQDLPVGYFSSWLCASQFLFGWLLGPFTVLIPPNPHHMSFYPTSLWDGIRCLRGINVLPGDECEPAPWLLPLSTFTTCLLSLVLIIVLKRYGAAFMYIVSTLRLPIINLVFTMKWVMGKDAQKAGVSNYLGLVVIFFGLVSYRFGPMIQEKIANLFTKNSKLQSINN